jgi:hypothetical protein
MLLLLKMLKVRQFDASAGGEKCAQPGQLPFL